MVHIKSPPWVAAAPGRARQGQHTQGGSRLWSAQRLWWWVELTHPPGGQAHTKGDIRPGGLGSHSGDSGLGQAGGDGRQVRSM